MAITKNQDLQLNQTVLYTYYLYTLSKLIDKSSVYTRFLLRLRHKYYNEIEAALVFLVSRCQLNNQAKVATSLSVL